MKAFVATLAVMLAMPLLPLANAGGDMDSSIEILEPSGGIYYYGERIWPSFTPFWTAFIGSSTVMIETEASSNIVSVYFTLYDIREKETVDKTLDFTPGDGFSCTFIDVPWGVYLVAAVALAVDIEEPVAADWHTPIFMLPV